MAVERQHVLSVLAALWLLLSSSPAAAQAPSSEAASSSEQARLSFERGYRLAEQGDLDGAIFEFEQAYRESPRYSVLYNLGQAYAAAGRPVEAVDTLVNYLALGGSAISAERRRQVQEAIAYHERRIGFVTLKLRPSSASVSLDGRALGPPKNGEELRVNSGRHSLSVSAPRHRERTLPLDVAAGKRQVLEVALEPEMPGELRVSCALPDVSARLDDEPIALSSTGTPLWPGRHRLELQRSGYLTQVVTLNVQSASRHDVACRLKADASSSSIATLNLRGPRGAELQVDGTPFVQGRLPAGRHSVSVTGRGFRAETRLIRLAPGEHRDLMLAPVPDYPPPAPPTAPRMGMLRTAAWAGAGVGLAALGAAAGLYLYDNGRRDAWDHRMSVFVTRSADPNEFRATELDALIAEENRIRDRDSIALGSAVFGATTLLVSSALLLWSRSATPASVVAQRSRSTVALRFGF